MPKAVLDDSVCSATPTRGDNNELLRSSIFTEDTIVSTDKDDSSDFKSTLYLPPLINCSQRPVRLVTKCLDFDKSFVRSFLLSNPYKDKAYCFKVQRVTPAVEVRPRKGIIKEGQEAVLHVILYPGRQTSSVNLIYVLVSNSFHCPPGPLKHYREPGGIWNDAECMFVLLHCFREERVQQVHDCDGETLGIWAWNLLLFMLSLTAVAWVFFAGYNTFFGKQDSEKDLWSFI